VLILAEEKKEILALSPSDYKIEVKHLEGRFDKSGYQRIAEPIDGPPVLDKNDKWREWAIQLVRYFNNEGEHTHTMLSVKSPHMKALLKRVIGDKYPDVSFLTADITVESPPKACYHYLPELRAEVKTLEGEERKHCDFFLEFLESEFEEVITEMKNLESEDLITYPLLWALFKPGEVVYSPQCEHDRSRAYTVKSYAYTCGLNPSFMVNTSFLTYDGTHFGHLGDQTKIRPFSGTRKITKLAVFPLANHPNAISVREKLIARGQKFEELRGKQYMHYVGLTRPEWDEIIQRAKTNTINGPIMIDREIYSRTVPDRSRRVLDTRLNGRRRRRRNGYESQSDDDDSDIEPLNQDDEVPMENVPVAELEPWRRPEDPIGYRPLTPEQHLICESSVYGFSFTEKVWGRFYVDLVQPPRWNDAAFDQLVLPATQKKLVRALVDSHVKGDRNFDDFIKDKGRGLIVILHGPPGVGKTLTAESVSHASRRPLYMVSSGELGLNAKELEQNLSRILEVASAWKAVVLLDEADVFLERRSEHDLARNALVSIFLRVLEYYQGILFLTTNRVRSFDEAFQSRIHVALKYGNLEKEARKSVWRNFLEKIPSSDVTEEGLGILAKHLLNGREIKNAIGTAKTLADADGVNLNVERLEEVLKIQEEFEAEMRAPEGGMYM
jgi:hypothetical protein